MTDNLRRELSWNKNKLLFKGSVIAKVFPDKRYKEMYWIRWYDGSESGDFYNLSRAKQHAIDITIREIEARPELEYDMFGQGSSLVR